MAHGGRRPNAGRKRGSGRYGESTRPLRIPVSRLEEVLRLLHSSRPESDHVPVTSSTDKQYWWPFYQASTAAPSDTSIIEPPKLFNLNAELLPHPENVVLVRAFDRAMEKAGIHEGDILIVDQQLPLKSGMIIAAFVNGELVVRYLITGQKEQLLMAANPHNSPLILTKDTSFTLLGVVTTVVHQL